MIVRWGLDQLPQALAEVGIENPYVIASERWRGLALPPRTGWWSEVPSENVPVSPERSCEERIFHRHQKLRSLMKMIAFWSTMLISLKPASYGRPACHLGWWYMGHQAPANHRR